MLKHRLLFGTLMTAFFAGLVVFDGYLDDSLGGGATDGIPKATIFCILIAVLVILGQFEFSRLAGVNNLKIFLPVSIFFSVLLATSWYWGQFIEIPGHLCLFLALSFAFMALMVYQYIRFGTSDVLANCGANFFSIIYLGLLTAFSLAIRIDFGLWPLLMFVFVVKSADTGAYAIGSAFGKRKFSPKISPGKTWEGMGGAVGSAIVVAVGFALICDIMNWLLAVVFGFCFAFIGQFGDLAESMIKRDAEQKDSASNVPGFGGILDIVDSPLVAAPFAYLFFMFCGR